MNPPAHPSTRLENPIRYLPSGVSRRESAVETFGKYDGFG